MLPVALTWQRIMSNEIFVKTVDKAMDYLFSWKADQARDSRAPVARMHAFQGCSP